MNWGVAHVHTQFYRDCLDENTNECQNESCVKAKSELNKNKEEIREKIRTIEEAISMCKSILSDKDDEIERLKKQAGTVTANIIASSSDTPPNAPQPNVSEEKNKSFIAFSTDFTEEELSHLRSISAINSGDSTFVAHCVKYLYKQNLSVLKDKSVTGNSRTRGQVKQPVTPRKYKIISEIFMERVNLITKNANESEARAKGLNIFIKNAIYNINRTTQTNEIEKNACEQLDLVSNLQEK